MAMAAIVWASNDPWKSKPYQQWDQKDVQKILQDSPWSKTIRVDANWESRSNMSEPSSPSEMPRPNSGEAPQGSAAGRSGGMSGGSPQAPASGGMESNASETATPQAVFTVRWISSRTLREALVRNAVLAGQMKESDAEADVARSPDFYQIVIAGPQMTPFETSTEEAVKNAAFLATKKAKQKIEAEKVEFQRSPDGRSIRDVIITFPRKSSTGEPAIGGDEKGVEFSLSLARTAFRANFDFSKMDDAQGRDL